jgi:hypothetical protein
MYILLYMYVSIFHIKVPTKSFEIEKSNKIEFFEENINLKDIVYITTMRS